MKKKKKWIRFRHKVVTAIGRKLIHAYARFKYGVKVERFQEQGKRQYLIAMNHQTAFDQFFVAIAFRGPIYYIASEDLFSKGWVSKLIEFLVAPIPIKKQMTDMHAVKNCIRVAREGGTIALAPEGNRTFSGRTGYMKPSIVKLMRALKLPLALFRIEGGYGVHPRWSDVVRKGKMCAYVSRVIEPEEYQALSDEEMYALIQKELYVDEASVSGTFYHKRAAEYLERAIYVCPFCGLSAFESRDDVITCQKCGRQVRYLPTKELKGVGFDFPFDFVGGWYDYQCDFINALNVNDYKDEPIYTDAASLSEVILYDRRIPIVEDAPLRLYGDRIEVGDELKLPFDKVSVVTVVGRNKLNIYYGGKLYQLKSDQRFNALKYVNIFYRYKNTFGGNEDGKFLGL